jgi:hypothetical protein
MRRQAKGIVAGLLFVLMLIVTADYFAYLRHQAWYKGIERDIYKGMPLSDLRAYLQSNGSEHGIRRLMEFNQDERHWFIFVNSNYSVITTFARGGVDGLLQGYVAVWLDEHDQVDHIDTFE